MNMRLFSIFSGLTLAVLSGCVVVGTEGSGGNGGTGGSTTDVGVGGQAGQGGAGGGTGGAGGGTPACAMIGCAEATTSNTDELAPCDASSAAILDTYAKCVCAQADCSTHGICAAKPKYDDVPSAACQSAIDSMCKDQLSACTGDL